MVESTLTPTMVRIGLGSGASRLDAEDAAIAAATDIRRSWSGWIAAENKRAYLRAAVLHELWSMWKKRAAGRQRDDRWAQDMPWYEPRDTVVRAYDDLREWDSVWECLAILPPRQREVLAWVLLAQWAGWDVGDVADALGIAPVTIRSHLRHARNTLKPVLDGDGHELRRWLLAGERLHEDFHRGRTGPFGPRPIIRHAWALLKKRGLDPQRGTRAVILDTGELQQRRQQSRVPTGSPVLAELADLATRNGLMAVVLDSHSTVLHRGGDRDALAAADGLGFVEGARWDLDHAGVNAAGLAAFLGRPITVSRWEHSFPDQHGLCCVAIPLRGAGGQRITVNLTAAANTLTSVPRALHPQLHTIALRLQQQLRTAGTH